MRQTSKWIVVFIGSALTCFVMGPNVARGACCIEGCGTIPWISCTASTACTGGVCPGPIGSAIAMDPNATCGTGTTFSGCPADEAGQCNDGVNNDAWLDDLTDCADPDCAADPACRFSAAPALSPFGLGALAALLVGFGGLSVARRRRT